MTRRLEPTDRVRELGNASVPFCFDIHAMIYSVNAPVLESRLHRVLEKRSVSRVNSRKEFFNVSLEGIEKSPMSTMWMRNLFGFPAEAFRKT